jgi:hypothetical protein
MRRSVIAIAAVILAFTAVWMPKNANATCFSSSTHVTMPVPCPNGGSYVGPGDVVASPLVWYGLRAVSASYATAGSKLANICNASDANCADVSSTSSGNFNVATATGSPSNCGGAGGTCTVKILIQINGPIGASKTNLDPDEQASGRRET